MTKAIVLASALLIGGTAFVLPAQMVLAAETKSEGATQSEIATIKERCERNATLQLYTGKQKANYIRECLAREQAEGKKTARQPGFHPLGPPAAPRVTPLGPTGAMGSTAPSNAPVVPSAPVTGSRGTSTTGSSATSTSGSSGTSIGGSGAR